MQITWSEEALSAWKFYAEKRPANAGLKLNYEAEGCGCALSGVIRLASLTDEDLPQAHEWRNGSTSSIPIYYEPRIEIFFEDLLLLQYNSERKCFKLSGKGQIYNPCMTIQSI